MTSTAEFSSNDAEVISREVHVNTIQTPSPGSYDFAQFYEIDRTVKCIQEGDYKRIALQFPDELLHDSVPIYHLLQHKLGKEKELYVLADTSYGSCCVDEVASSHVDADFVVHYGHACLSQTSRLPVLYVFGRMEFNIETCVDKISSYLKEQSSDLQNVKSIEVFHAVELTHSSGDLVNALRQVIRDRFRVLYTSVPNLTQPIKSTDKIKYEKDKDSPASTDEEPKLIIWIGEESTTLTKILMTSSQHPIISYSPSSGLIQHQTQVSNKMLRRRYAILQKARDADVFGILIGTLGVASYLPLINLIRNQLKKAHKKSYTVSVGKINPAKLANFMEIECWVWVACNEGMVDSKDFLRPIITPFELGLALQDEPTWTNEYILDFQEIISRNSGDADNEEKNKEGNDTDKPSFSLVTGTYRHAKRYHDGPEISEEEKGSNLSQDLIKRSQESTLAKIHNSAAAQFLQERSYRGLDPRLGSDLPSVLEQGRTGIARDYEEV
ncbi:diphthamide biosynthesis [Pyrrhoderma noxium]|uniref:2-(3-amino-3-carboxypropyl)histidine synthase subunit 2 n=1 Tax=Pyrrhoderma noxium TaxID=2282107 RepID=A0A286UB77_9AGAM|nr:diphthamide biosynthesis [Pyrrhoderma noxium]